MASTVTLAGHKVNKWVAYGTGGAVIVGGVLIMRRRSSASSSGSSSSSAQSGTDPVTGLPYSMDNQVDPVTGLTYLAEAQQYGSVSAAEASVGAGYGGVSGTGTGYSGTAYGSPTFTTTDSSTPGATTGYTTNQEWAAAVQAALPAITGDTASDVATAVAHYLASLPLTSTQANDIQVAIAEFGPPPVGTFSIVTQGSGSGPTTTGSGTPPPAQHGPITVTPVNLHVTQVYTNSAQVAWLAPTLPSGQGPIESYEVAAYDQHGTLVNGPFSVPPSQLYGNIGGLKSKTAYHVNVWCNPAKSGGPHASTSFTTK